MHVWHKFNFQLDSFSMGTNENSRNILISHDITSEKLERKRKDKKENEKPEKNK